MGWWWLEISRLGFVMQLWCYVKFIVLGIGGYGLKSFDLRFTICFDHKECTISFIVLIFEVGYSLISWHNIYAHSLWHVLIPIMLCVFLIR